MGAAKRYFLEQGEAALYATPNNDPPRLTLRALEKIAMSRSRERILNNLDEMYRESFERAKATERQLANGHARFRVSPRAALLRDPPRHSQCHGASLVMMNASRTTRVLARRFSPRSSPSS